MFDKVRLFIVWLFCWAMSIIIGVMIGVVLGIPAFILAVLFTDTKTADQMFKMCIGMGHEMLLADNDMSLYNDYKSYIEKRKEND